MEPRGDKSENLRAIVLRLLVKGKGILAADESVRTMNSRLESAGALTTPEMRREFRELLFTALDIERYLSGVILFDETLRSSTEWGAPFADLLTARGIIPGIKVDKGTVPLEGFPNEMVTEGLDGLAGRLAEYYTLGARFTKWRAVFSIGEGLPSEQCLRANALTLARFASLSQAAGMAPIVEPEALFHGSHSIAEAAEATIRVLSGVCAALVDFHVDFGGVVVKSSMVLAGDGHREQSTPEEVADATLRAFRTAVPKEVPGIVLLSGGQTPRRATENLQAIARQGPQPWTITFSYSRALEEPVLAAWKGKRANREAAQAALVRRLGFNARAQTGEYDSSLEADVERYFFSR